MVAEPLIDTYTIRATRPADVEDVVRVVNANVRVVTGRDEMSAEELASDWESPDFDLARDTRVVLTPAGELVAYGELYHPHGSAIRSYAWVHVHPDHWGRGIATALNEWVEAHAREGLDRAPEGVRVVLQAVSSQENAAAADVLLSLGYSRERYFQRMVIELNGAPPVAEWPKGIVVRTVRQGEEPAVFRAVDETFRDHWGHIDEPFEVAYPAWQHTMLGHPGHDPSLWHLAVDGDQIAGFSLGLASLSEEPDMGWVRVLGVRRDWRQRGIALALLHHSFAEFHRRGRKRVGLSVDAANLTGAVRLYRRAGMHPAETQALFQKELRPGRDVMTGSNHDAEAGGREVGQ